MENIFDEFIEQFLNNIGEISFPYDVHYSAEDLEKYMDNTFEVILQRNFLGSNNPNELKKIKDKNRVIPKRMITDIFCKRGFTYKKIRGMAAKGYHIVTKRLDSNNQIRVAFHYWARQRDLSCLFTFHGPYWEHSLEIPISFEDNEIINSYSIYNNDVLKKVVENCYYLVEHLEETIVKELDSIYGSAPRWFSYLE